MLELKEIEKSIIKTYRKSIWSNFIKGIQEYNLVQDNDRIMVCISGGKDSFLMAKCFQELKKHGKIKFDLEFVVMNPGYNKENGELIEKNAKHLNIDIKIFKSDIFEIVDNVSGKGACYLCARMRRGHLYNKARELNCNKIALGHHFDDVIETTLLSMFYNGEFKTMLPKLKSRNFEGLELIRPMYYIKEKDIINWANNSNLRFLNCACRFLEKDKNKELNSKRKEIKKVISELKKSNDKIDNNIFTSLRNVNMEAIIGYKKEGVEHSYLEEY